MTAQDRLFGGYYNSGAFSGANPGGLANGGHVTNFPAALQDIGTVAQGVGAQAAAAAGSAGAAGGYAATALAERNLAQTAHAGAVTAKNAAEAAAASVPTLDGYASVIRSRRVYTGGGQPSIDTVVTPEHGFDLGTSGVTGPYLVAGSFNGGNNPLQLVGAYSGGNQFIARTRNHDTNAWNPWRSFWHDGNFNPSSKANLSGPAFNSSIAITGASGTYRELQFQTAGLMRWDLFADTTPESVGNAGSNFLVVRYADNGAFLGIPITVNRSSGQVAMEVRPTWAGFTPYDTGNFVPASKADLAGALFTGGVTAPALIARSGAGGSVGLSPGDANYTGLVEFRTAANVRLGYFGFAHGGAGKVLTFVAENGGSYDFAARPTFAGAVPWDSGNLTLDALFPAGELKLFDTASPPSGSRVIAASGSTVSRVTYARLFAAIGTRYGAGDGSTTFTLPDWRGMFFRGLDSGRGVDTGRTLGSYQASQNLSHYHGTATVSGGGSGGGGGIGDTAVYAYGSTDSEGGAEARPVNHALLACISY